MIAHPLSDHYSGIIRASHANGPVRKNTTSEAAATLADKQGFVTSESQAGAGTPCADLSGFGRGGPTRKDGRTASDVFLTPRPPDARKNADGGCFHVPEGSEMPATTPEMGKPTHARTVTKRRDHLPFIVDTFGPRGARKDTAHFCPEVGTLWSTGHLAGITAARDLIRALRNADDALSLASLRWQSTSVIRDAAAAAANRKDGEAMQAAGDAFIQQIAEALKFAAKHGAFDAYFDARIAEAEQTHERVLQENKRRTERAIAARRSKLRTQIGGAA